MRLPLQQELVKIVRAGERQVAGGAAVLLAYRLLFAAVAAARALHWAHELAAGLEETYIAFPAPFWSWLPPPSPWAVHAACSTIVALAALIAAGVWTRTASAALACACAWLAAYDGDPGSQLTSLLLQLGVANCLLPLSGGPLLRMLSPLSAPAPLWALALLRFLAARPHAQDALAKLADGASWLARAQPLASRLAPAARGVPGAGALPWLAAWASLLLDLAAPPLLLRRETRATLGLACVAVAQSLNGLALGLDGWWLLLALNWLVWLPPELVAAALGRLAGGRGGGGSGSSDDGGDGDGVAGTPSPAASLRRRAAARAADDMLSSGWDGTPPARWSQWFWQGRRHRRGGGGGGPSVARALEAELSAAVSGGAERQCEGPAASPPPSAAAAPLLPSTTARTARPGAPAGALSAGAAARAACVLALLLFHVAAPLRFLAYPSRPAWTEESLVAPWHRRLADKRGWIIFVVREQRPHPLKEAAAAAAATAAAGGAAAADGRVIDVAPEADPLLGPRAAAALAAGSPSAALRYAARLARVAAAAGRPLASVRALSCFGLNGGRHRALFDATVDLLRAEQPPPPPPPQQQQQQPAPVLAEATAGEVAVAAAGSGSVGGGGGRAAASAAASAASAVAASASAASASAVSRWVHDHDTAPRCDPYASPRDRPGLIRRSRQELGELQAAAGLFADVAADPARPGGLRRRVCWDGGGGGDGGDGRADVHSSSRCPLLAYLWR